MVVGVLKLKLLIPENHSLKGKARRPQTIQARVANQFNVSVAECGDQDFGRVPCSASQLPGYSAGRSSEASLEQGRWSSWVDELGLAEVGEAGPGTSLDC